MRIDSHQHFWRYNPIRDQWITSEMAVLQRDFLPEHLVPELRISGIDGCIAVQADQSEAETLFLLQMARSSEVIRGMVGWVDLCSENLGDRLEAFSKEPKLRGFRHIVQAEPDDRFMLRAPFLRGIGCLRAFDFTYDILVYPRQLPAAIDLVAKHSDQPFVIDHIGKPEIKAKRNMPWCQHMRELAENTNVYCKVSGLVTEADWQHWQADDFKPYLDVVFESFGIDRIMFGSDWPVCLLAATYAQVVQIVSDYTSYFSASDKENIFGLNAARFYGIADY